MPPTPCLPTTYLEALDPVRPALRDGDTTLSFGDLLERARAAARRLEGTRVALHLPNCWEYVALELAVPLAGGIVVPLPMSLGPAEVAWALEKTGARLVEKEEAESLCRPGRGIAEPPPPDPTRVVEIALTSGTTGLPKLASLTAGLKQATFEGFTQRLQVSAEDRVLPLTPLAQGIGGMCLYCLRAGASLLLQPADLDQATLIVGVPTNLIRLLRDPDLARVGARCTAVAGAPLPPDVASEWEERTGSKVVSFYGSMDAGQLAVGSPDDPRDKRWHTVGRPHDSCQVKMTPEGEICMRGPTVQERYWGEQRGPFAEDGWAHLGDLGFVDEDGFLHVTGRLKDIVIRGGTNINPYEVEAELRTHPRVADVCIVGRPDRELGERVLAFVVARGPVTLEDLRAHLEGRGLARYKWPEHLELIPEIPLRGPGKVDRRALRERAGAGALR